MGRQGQNRSASADTGMLTKGEEEEEEEGLQLDIFRIRA